MGDAPDFITSFHNLEGDLIGERKKSLYKLIITSSVSINEQQQNYVLDKLDPKTYQENLFYVDTLIYFRRTQKLLEILKGGNQHFATKILKQPWFFEQAFQNIDADVLVNEYIPYFSYVVRKKLLIRVSKCWPENKMDNLYDALYKIYGLSAATPILQKCSVNKIKSVLEVHEVKLNPNQVIELSNKSDDILNIYLDHFKSITRLIYDEHKVVKYLASNNPKLLLEVQKSEKLAVRSIGKRSTKTIIKIINIEDMSNDTERYTQFLHNEILVKQLGPTFKTIYKQIFPKAFINLPNFHCSNKLLEKYPKKRRWQLFYEVCKEVFSNKSEKDILFAMSEKIKQLEPPEEILHKWAEIQYEKREKNYEYYLKYFSASEAIEIVKEKIQRTSDNRRREDLLKLLIQICSDNKNLIALADTLEYIDTRHKHESTDTKFNLLTLINDGFNLTDLEENHWKYIYEQIRFLKIHNHWRLYNTCNLLSYYLQFLSANRQDSKQAYMLYLTLQMESHTFYYDNDKNKEIVQEIYIGMCNVFPEVFTKESESYHGKICAFINKLIYYSIELPNNCIDLTSFPVFVTYIHSVFNREFELDRNHFTLIANVIKFNHTFPENAVMIENSVIIDIFSSVDNEYMNCLTKVLKKIFTKKERNELINQLVVIYFDRLDKHGDTELLPWFVKNEPRLIIPYFDTILKLNSDNIYENILDSKIVKQYSHLDLDRKTKEYMLQQLDTLDEEDTRKFDEVIGRLFQLLTVEEMIKLVEDKFLPKQDKLDIDDVEMRTVYKVQCDVAAKLGKVDEPYRLLTTIMKFAKGDYLHSTLPSLYTAFYRSPERMLYSFAELLVKQAVSARKHAVFLSCEILNYKYTLNLLKTTDAKNVSSHKHLLSATVKYFLKNPSQGLYEIVLKNMETIDKNDTETLENLSKINIPIKYRSNYIETCWYFYENLETNGVIVDEYLRNLTIDERIVTALSYEFVAHLLKKYFIKNTPRVINESFIIMVLKHRISERVSNFDLVFEMLLKSSRTSIICFFDAFLDYILKEKDVDKSFVFLFYQYWYKHFTIIKTLKCHIALKLALLKFENESIESYAQSALKYMDEITAELSFLVFSVFEEQVRRIVNVMNVEDKYKFFLAAVSHRTDADTCILILGIMESVHDDDSKELSDIYKKVIDIIKQVNIPIVVASYKVYLEKNE